MDTNNNSLPSPSQDGRTTNQSSGLFIAQPGAPPSLPGIQVNARELPMLIDDCIDALLGSNDPPRLFIHGGALAAVGHDDDGRPSIVPMDRPLLADHLGQRGRFFVRKGNREHAYESPAIPPRHAVDGVLARVRESGATLGFPVLNGVTDVPVFRRDGTLLTQPGYDNQTGLILHHRPDLPVLDIPAKPLGPLGGIIATIPIDDIIGDFPFVDAASRANAFAKLLTPFVRPMISGSVPLALTTAPRAGTGKGLLDDVVSILATGSEMPKRTLPEDDNELRKTLTSILIAEDRLVVFDNIRDGTSLNSAVLASCLTCRIWQDRPLGTNSTPNLPQKVFFSANGNNVVLGGDMPRRVFLIKLDAMESRPWERDGFRHKRLLQYVREHRGKLVTAILTMVSQWILAGRPPAPESTPVLGSFEEWCTIVGGILHYWGIEGFLGNSREVYEESDPNEQQWQEFLSTLYRVFDGGEFTSKEVVSQGAQIVLPDNVNGSDNDSKARSLGILFGRNVGRPYGQDRIRVTKAERAGGGSKMSGGIQVWRIEIGRES